MAIGGLWALRLHGLAVRDAQDLDIIVYGPVQEFIDFLVQQNTNEFGSQPNTEDREGNKWRSWKIHRNGLTVDFLLEFDEQPPEDCLVYYFKGRLWRVQGIDTVIDKKAQYGRDKDVIDFKNFKKDNFNL